MSLFKLEKYESTLYTLVNLLRQDDNINSSVYTEINRNSNTTLKQTVKLYQDPYKEIRKRNQI